MNLLRARSPLSRSNGAASTFACALGSSIMPFACFLQRFKPRAHILSFDCITTGISVEGRWQLALAEDHGRLIVIVTHLGVAGGGEGDDAKLAQCQPFRCSRRVRC